MLIRNATMILPETTVIGDLLIVDGIISAIQPGGGFNLMIPIRRSSMLLDCIFCLV